MWNDKEGGGDGVDLGLWDDLSEKDYVRFPASYQHTHIIPLVDELIRICIQDTQTLIFATVPFH